MIDLTGIGPLMRLILRRDRVILPIWVFYLAIIPLVTLGAFQGLYPTDTAAAAAARGFGSNPAFLAMFGPVFAGTIGAISAWRASIAYVVLGVISLLTVIRHTRVEEETGRRELIGSAVVGRHAPLAAAVVVVSVANLLIGVVTTVGFVVMGQPVAGSVAMGLAMALSGIVFTGIGALAAQLTESAGAARAIGLSIAGLAYVLRAAGDAGGSGSPLGWLSALSPFAWAQRLRPFAGEQWWLIVPLAALAAAAVAGAFALAARRDVGGGIIATRPGRAEASPRLATPLGLAWRLHRGLVLGWAAGFAVLGLIYGSVAEGVSDILIDNPDLREIFERLGGGSGTIIDLFLAGVMGVIGLVAAGYAVQATLRLRAEEETLRAEPVLATAVGRVRWMASHLVFALGGPVVALASAGLAIGVTYGLISGDLGGQLPRALGAAVAQAPAVWVLGGIAVVLFGNLPRATQAAWGAYGAVAFVSVLGAALRLGQWFLDLSPFTHVPRLPGGPVLVLPLVLLVAVAGVLVASGLVGFRRRDLA